MPTSLREQRSNLSIVIVDLLGKAVYNKGVLQSYLLLNDGVIIDGSGLENGVYLLQLVDKSTSVVVGRGKVVKQ